MSISSKFIAGAVALSALGAVALATSAAAASNNSCFFVNQWQGWKADGPNILYLRVNLRDIYRVDLSAGAQQLTWAGSYHLVNQVRGSDSVCGPLDLRNPDLDFVALGSGLGVESSRADTIEAFEAQFAAAMAQSGPRLIEVLL